MDDRQQAGASQLSVPQDAPGQTGELNRSANPQPADAAAYAQSQVAQTSGNTPVQENAARANLRHLPTFSNDQNAKRGEDAAAAQAAAAQASADVQRAGAQRAGAVRYDELPSEVEQAGERLLQTLTGLTDDQEKPVPQAQQKQQALASQAAAKQQEGEHPADAAEASQPSEAAEPSAGPDDVSQAETAELPRDARRPVSPRAARSEAPSPAKKPSKRTRRTILIVICSILCVYVLAFSWNQWFRGDDKADIQGVWQIAGTEQTITITKDYLQLTPDLRYSYSIDSAGKAIAFSFSELSGQGRYRFSLDRNQLAIIEGPSFSTVGNTVSDLFWSGRALFWWVFTQEMVSPGVETTEQRNQEEAAKQAEIEQQKAEEAQNTEPEAVASSDYVLGQQLLKKAQAIKGIKATSDPDSDVQIELPTECTLLIRLDQPVEVEGEPEKPVMIIDLRGTSSSETESSSEATREKKPLIVEVPPVSTPATEAPAESAQPADSDEPGEPPSGDGDDRSS